MVAHLGSIARDQRMLAARDSTCRKCLLPGMRVALDSPRRMSYLQNLLVNMTVGHFHLCELTL